MNSTADLTILIAAGILAALVLGAIAALAFGWYWTAGLCAIGLALGIGAVMLGGRVLGG